MDMEARIFLQRLKASQGTSHSLTTQIATTALLIGGKSLLECPDDPFRPLCHLGT